MNELHIVNDYYPQQTGDESDSSMYLRKMQELSDDIDFCITIANRYQMIIDKDTLQVFKEFKQNIKKLSRRIK